MSSTSILTKTQTQFLELLGKTSFASNFYLSGGTALASFYIPYRYSEDLDFFSMEEVNVDEIIVFIRSIKSSVSYKTFDFNTSFNRNIFFLQLANEILKLEFTYYPFLQIETGKKEYGVYVDSPLDIAVNKLFTIYQKPRTRDFMDLYMLITKYHYQFADLIMKAKLKFDWHVDPIKLGAQLLQVEEVKDYPNLITPIEDKKWQSFYIEQAKKLKKEIIEE